MKRILLLLLLLPLFLFAQYGNNVASVINTDFENLTAGTPDDGTTDTFTSFTNVNVGVGNIVEQVTDNYHGTYAVKQTSTTQQVRMESAAFTVAAETDYKLTFYYKVTTGLLTYYIVRDATNSVDIVNTTTGSTPSTYTRFDYSFTTPVGCISILLKFKSGGTSHVNYFDYASVRIKLAKIYVNSSTGNDSNLGESGTPIATVSECFETRGTYSTGLIDLNGTFNESITLINDFGTISASAPSTITSVDFAGKTGTVDLANLTIATKLNDSNVTYLNVPSTDSSKGYRSYPKHNQYNGYH